MKPISGYPLGVVGNAYMNYLRGGEPRPDVLTSEWRAPISGDKFDPRKDMSFDVSAFARRTNPALDPIGKAPRLNGDVRAYPAIPESITAMRGFEFAEEYTVNFRWEVYSLFNHHGWSNPGLDLSNSGTFGIVTSANGNRSMQLGLKIAF